MVQVGLQLLPDKYVYRSLWPWLPSIVPLRAVSPEETLGCGQDENNHQRSMRNH